MSAVVHPLATSSDRAATAEPRPLRTPRVVLGCLTILVVVVSGIAAVWSLDSSGPATIVPTVSSVQPSYRWAVTTQFSDPSVTQPSSRGQVECRVQPNCVAGIFQPTCVDSLRCLAVAMLSGSMGVVATLDGGSSWRTERLPDGLYNLGPLSCRPSGWCAAVAFGKPASSLASVLLQTHDLGATWSTATINGSRAGPEGVACPAQGTCLVTAPRGGSVLVTHDAGRSWSSAPLPTYGPNSFSPIECASVRTCWAYGFTQPTTGAAVAYLDRTDNGGESWHSQAFPAILNGPSFGALKCPDRNTCWITGFHLTGPDATPLGNFMTYRSVNGGATWTQVVFPNQLLMNTASLGCTDRSTCWDLAQASHDPGPSMLLTTSDGGAHWASHRIAAKPIPPYNFAVCPSDQRCLVGTNPYSPRALIARLDPAPPNGA